MGVQAGEPHLPAVHPRLSSDYCVLWCKCTHIQINVKTGLKAIVNHTKAQDRACQQALRKLTLVATVAVMELMVNLEHH